MSALCKGKIDVLTKAIKLSAFSFVLTVAVAGSFPNAASAQPIPQPNSLLNWIPANQAPQQGQPPPPGDGNNAQPVIGGDKNIAPPPVPTGQAQTNPVNGTNFPTQINNGRSVIYLYKNTTGPLGSRGTRADATIRPDQLSQQELGQIQGILGINLNSGLPQTDVVVTPAQLAEIQQVLAPYPQTNLQNGWQVINTDTPAAGYPKPGEQSIYQFQGPLPTVRTFSRYLVILGVVCATIFMALASYSMVLGHPYGGARVIGTAAGFMLLLMGYTIWKIVQMNTFNAMSNTPPINQNRPGQAQVNNVQAPILPVVPNAPGGRPNRSGIPVLPLSGN